jgi:D-methionine transport system ATP-binding protein
MPQLRLEQVSLFAKLKAKSQSNLPGYPILQDISLTVERGDRLAIVGLNGAGKTSLLKLINRLNEPSSGKIYLESQEYRQIPVIQLRQQVTLVLQTSRLLGMTVKEALTYPLALRRLPQQTIQQRIDYWREHLQIPDDWLARTEVQLSAGQKQLVAIARALVIQPQILLLDEPTSALDSPTAFQVINTLKRLNQAHSTTILMVNHHLDQAQSFCTQLLHLHQGQILANRPTHEIDWSNLKTTLLESEKQAAAEWE